MIKNGEVYFCDPCSARGDYLAEADKVMVDDLLFEVEDGQIFTFYTSIFVDYPHRSMNVGYAFEEDSSDARQIDRLAAANEHDYDEQRISETFCKRIGACTGMELTDGGPICPAFNSSELRRLL